jgi:hypothetical protein
MLLLVFGWALLSLLYRAPLACEVFQTPSFCGFIIALVITFSGYVVADLYRESFMRDVLRGWSRIAFLLIDVVAMVFLFRVSKQKRWPTCTE